MFKTSRCYSYDSIHAWKSNIIVYKIFKNQLFLNEKHLLSDFWYTCPFTMISSLTLYKIIQMAEILDVFLVKIILNKTYILYIQCRINELAKIKNLFIFQLTFIFSKTYKYKQAVNKNYGIIKKRLMIAL